MLGADSLRCQVPQSKIAQSYLVLGLNQTKVASLRALIRGGPTIAVVRADIATWMGVMRAAVPHMYCKASTVKP